MKKRYHCNRRSTDKSLLLMGLSKKKDGAGEAESELYRRFIQLVLKSRVGLSTKYDLWKQMR